jgi:hypothetical protein
MREFSPAPTLLAENKLKLLSEQPLYIVANGIKASMARFTRPG